MKKLLLLFAVFALVACQKNTPEPTFDLPEPDDSYYIVSGGRTALARSGTKSYILFKTSDTEEIAAQLAEMGVEFDPSPKNPGSYFSDCTYAYINEAYDEVRRIEKLIYCTPYYADPQGNEIAVSEDLYVIFKDGIEPDEDILRQLAEQTGTIYIGAGDISTDWYGFVCTKNSVGNSLEVANMLYATGLFEMSAANMHTYAIFL